jgi:hypothetical protein
MTPDSAPESILFVDTEFALERVEWLLSEFRNARSAKDVASGVVIDEMLPETKVVDYGLEIFQARDPKDPPLSYSFEGSKFYIRACYKVYYDLIIACLESGRIDYVTLVGTPGTGKSLLYLYVFRRYRLDNPNVTIVVATFDKGSKMIECWKYKPGKDPKRCSEIPATKNAVHFYDGPPSRLPRYRKMVCFSCPNYNWIDLHRKEVRHECLWFPPWTLEELVDANDVCELGLGEETITDRYNFFGGSARYCLSTDDRFVERGRGRLQEKTLSIDSRDKLQLCLRDSGNDTLSHQIFHLMPEISDIFPFVFLKAKSFACSKAVDDLICTRIREKQKAQHHELVEMIRDIPEASSFRGILFERSTHLHLGRGGGFELRSLDSSRNFIQEIPAGRYSKMKTGCESIDGVVVLDDRVLLFQATVASTHSVNAHGICEVLKSIGKLDDFVNGNTEVLLVFVVPPDTTNFRKQQIRVGKSLNDDSSIPSIKRMRHAWCIELEKQEITCVGQLRGWLARPHDDDREKFAPYLADFDSRNFNSKYNEQIRGIAQYALTMLVKPDQPSPDKEDFISLVNENKRLMEENASLKSQIDAAAAQLGA